MDNVNNLIYDLVGKYNFFRVIYFFLNHSTVILLDRYRKICYTYVRVLRSPVYHNNNNEQHLNRLTGTVVQAYSCCIRELFSRKWRGFDRYLSLVHSMYILHIRYKVLEWKLTFLCMYAVVCSIACTLDNTYC